MRICLVDTTLDGDLIGGAQTFLGMLIPGLVSNGNAVYLVTKGEIHEKVRGKLHDSGARTVTDVWNPWDLPEKAGRKLAEWAAREEIDVFVVSVSPDVGWIALPMIPSITPTLAIGHTASETFYSPVRHYSEFLTRVVGVSDTVCSEFEYKCGIPRDRIDWIPYGVKALSAPPSDTGASPLNLIYVGRMDEQQKRVSDLAKLLEILDSRGVEFKAVLVGDGPELSGLRERLQGLVERRQVEFTGWLGQDEVLRRLRESEIFVLVSAYEGFCISLVEAIANGCCPLVTDIESGNRQLVADGESGYIVPVGDMEVLADRLCELNDDRLRLSRLRTKAWEEGSSYSVARMVERYERAFAQAVEDAKSSPRRYDNNFELMPSCRSKYPNWLRVLKARAESLLGSVGS